MARRVNKKREISAVLYFAVALLLAVTFYVPAARTGFLGQVLLAAGRGLLGVSAFALPVIFLYMAIDYVLEKRRKVTRLRMTYLFLLLGSVSALMHLITLPADTMRRLAVGEQGEPLATQALHLAFRSGIDPEPLMHEGLALPGGLLGGGLSMALDQIAGHVGGIVILAAFILSLLILLLNVSISRAVGQTAKAVQTTRRKVDQAVRSGAAARQAKDPQSYDLEVGEDDDPDENLPDEDELEMNLPESEGKRGWKDSWNRFWSGRGQNEADTLDPKDDAAGEKDDEGIHQKSAYDLEVKRPQWLKTPADENEGPEYTEFGHGASRREEDEAEEGDAQDDAPLPAGVHRVDPADEADALEQDRARWADRSEDPGERSKDEKAWAAGGEQVSLAFQPPPLKLLTMEKKPTTHRSNLEINRLGSKLEKTLKDFGIDAKVLRHSTGPTITRFELTPGSGVKVSRIVNLADDIALNLAAMGVRIEAPIPGKAAIGIEIPNKETTPVLLRGLLESPEYQKNPEPLTVAIGRDIQGQPILCDLTKMPHLLIAGATGSGKSVCINSILMSILFKSSPDEVRLALIDPKVVELNVYNGIPHLITPVVTDPKKAANALMWAVNEMTRRYSLFADKSVRDIRAYRDAAQFADEEDEFEKLPLILLVIDELSDLMATSPTEVEDAIARLTAMARAAGIHLIIATQRPSVDVITGVIKANIPSRIAFAVASQVDSRTILDTGGAEKLLGKGDMLYYPQSAAKPQRGQGAFISDPEVERVLKHIKGQHGADYDDSVTQMIKSVPKDDGKKSKKGGEDELLPQALEIVVEAGYASVSILQRRMNVGYPRAARLIDTLHEEGLIGPFEGSKPRKVLISPTQLMEMQSQGSDAEQGEED